MVKNRKTQGKHYVYWDGSDEEGGKVPKGIYFCRLRAGNTYHDIVKLVEIR